MDRQSIIGLSLIAIIFVAWFYISSLMSEAPKPQQEKNSSDTTQIVKEQKSDKPIQAEITQQAVLTSNDSLFVRPTTGSQRLFVQTEKYRAEVSNFGAAISSFEILDYQTDHHPVQLISDSTSASMNYSFKLNDGNIINTKQVNFQILNENQNIKLTHPNDSVLVSLYAKMNGGQEIFITYTFYGSGYVVGHTIKLVGFGSSVVQQNIKVQWLNGIRYSEKNITDENAAAEGHIYVNGDNDYLNATSTTEDEEIHYSGKIGWSAIRTKYFAVAFINSDNKANSSKIWGRTTIDKDNVSHEHYNMVQYSAFNGENSWTKQTNILLTPLEYNYLKSFDNGLQYMMSLGMPYIVKPISEYFILPVFEFLYSYIFNWGLVIIVFTFLIRFITWPLTESSYKGMAKMREFTPKMQEIQAKYKDDKEKLQSEMLKFYRENGYNPLGGCLPMLLQMPILFALYVIFAHAIELRQSEFLWSSDLSLPDSILQLPFSIPLYGNHVSLWALLMAGSMILQMNNTPQTNKEQAVIMKWIFPVMMLLMFNNLSSGLNMYYFLSNILQFGQQWWYNKRNQTSSLLLETTKN